MGLRTKGVIVKFGRVLTGAVLVVMLAHAAEARPAFRGWGPRGGLTIDPDQIHFGVHTDLGDLAKNVRFQPNLEIGFGDNLTLFAVNAEAFYQFESEWAPYVGGGLGVNHLRFDYDDDPDNPFDDDISESDTELGVNILGGVELRDRDGDTFFLEGKFGLIDSPDFKLTLGLTLR
jgi:hypothetical protein